MDSTEGIYDDIAPIYDHEVKQIINELLADQGFINAVEYIIPGVDWDELGTQMRSFENKYDFQKNIIHPLVHGIARKTASAVEGANWDTLDKVKPYLYISNHRDIILDAGILNILLLDHGMNTTEIAIGDNLFVYPWIKKLVRLNKSFIVKRNVVGREILLSSKHMSEYIHYVITQKKESIWLAQREGRAKDSNDRTQESLVKMLAMAPAGIGFIDSLKELNIVPLSLSYEYDPCDYLKAKEFQMKRDDPEYKKSQHDDLLNMEKGLLGYKGNIHFQFGNQINSDLDKISLEPDKKVQVELAAKAIDREIHRNYKIYPINYIAYDMLNKSNQFSSHYSDEQAKDFKKYIESRIDKIDLKEKDRDFLWTKFLEMYSNTLKNHLIASEE
ncbi:MAG: 1-acyl-sn-glycerol-3-phosphate acyltransferase [Dysgonomonas sp.]